MKKFLIGIGIVSIIVVIYSVMTVVNQNSLEIYDFIFSPFVFYIFSFFAGVLTKRIYSKKIYLLTKYAGILFFIVVTLAISEWEEIETMYPLIISISLLFNWNTEEEKLVRQKSEKEFIETKPKPVLPYLINFIVLVIVFIIVSLCYYMIETIKDGIWTVIIIYGISFIIIYWIFYLVYRFLLRDTKIVQITKVGVIFISLYMIYYYCSSIDDMPYHLLLAYLLVSVVSLTTQNLILTRKRREER